jgi:hypothetical protein
VRARWAGGPLSGVDAGEASIGASVILPSP